MDEAEFLDVDPMILRLPNSRRFGADPGKLQWQISRFGKSTLGMPAIWVYRGSDGVLLVSNGVTRATRVAKLLPGETVRVEVIGTLRRPFSHLPTIGDCLP